jgi:hypothetical protein
MGYYIQVEQSSHGKAEQISATYDGCIIPQPESFASVPRGRALICVVNNGPFEAAGFCYDESEFRAFTEPGDSRKKKFVLMDWDKACELSRYKR